MFWYKIVETSLKPQWNTGAKLIALCCVPQDEFWFLFQKATPWFASPQQGALAGDSGEWVTNDDDAKVVCGYYHIGTFSCKTEKNV